MDGKQKILLVDNNEFIRIYFREVRWMHGLESKYDMEVASDIDEAEHLIRNPSTRPTIIFLGLVMPMVVNGRSVTTAKAGLSLLEKIKTNDELKSIKVIIFTGYDEEKYRKQAMKLGADGYLLKGENMPHELIAFIEKLQSNG